MKPKFKIGDGVLYSYAPQWGGGRVMRIDENHEIWVRWDDWAYECEYYGPHELILDSYSCDFMDKIKDRMK